MPSIPDPDRLPRFLAGRPGAGSTHRSARAGALACVCALMALAAPSPTVGQDAETVDVTGVVGDAGTGQPIVGAVVSLPDLGRKTVTLEGGRFVLLGLPPGEHRIRVSMLGYADWEERTVFEHLDLLRIGLLPRPVDLANIRVTVNRLERMRRAASTSVVAVDRDQLVRSPYSDVATALRSGITANTSVRTVPCSAGGPMLMGRELQGGTGDPTELCVRWRGQVVRPKIIIDQFPADFAFLSTYHPAEIYAIEFYQNGRCIRAFTTDFMERGERILPWRVACM